MAETKITSIRADEETAAAFKKLTENFPNAGEALKALIAAHEMETAKEAMKGQETYISDFQSHLDAVMRAYIGTLDIISNTENRVRLDYQEMLDSKDKMIISLQTDNEELKAAVTSAELSLQEVTERAEQESREAAGQTAELIMKADQAEQARTAAEKSAAAVAENNRLLSEQNKELKEKLSAASARADKTGELENLLNLSQDKNTELQKEIERLKDISELEKDKAAAALIKAVSEVLQWQKT